VLHAVQTRSSDEKAVRLSVCPSVKCVDCDEKEEGSGQTSMTLNDLERHNSPYFAFTEFDSFAGPLCHGG